MKLRALVVPALVSLLLVMGCAKKDDAAAPASIGPSGSAPATSTATSGEPPAHTAKTVAYTSDDKGKTADLKVGDTLRITLDENPSTGYAWKIREKPPKSVLASNRDKFLQPTPDPKSPPVAGRGGEHVWGFMAVGVGTAEIQLDLFPPGSDKASETYTITAKVT
jgi:predicted secreted protein